MSFRIRRTWANLLLGVALFAAVPLASSALAHDQGLEPPPFNTDGYEWRIFHAVGPASFDGKDVCPSPEQTSSTYVRSVKAIVWADGSLSDIDDVNQIYGEKAYAAIKSYQNNHGLDNDGCVGYYTWSNMQHYRHYDTQTDTYKPHIRSDGTVGFHATAYKWREWEPYDYKPKFVRYMRYHPPSGDEGGEYGCWHTLKVKNESTGNETVFGHSRVDHDSDGQCD